MEVKLENAVPVVSEVNYQEISKCFDLLLFVLGSRFSGIRSRDVQFCLSDLLAGRRSRVVIR